MKLLRIALMLIFITAFMSVAVHAQDEETEEDEGFTLGILEDGDTFAEAFTADVTARIYAFNATEGDMVTITMNDATEDGLVDPYLVLLGGAGEVIAVDDDSGEAALDSLIEVEIPSSGGYFILASTFSDVRTMNEMDEELAEDMDPLAYELTVTGNTPPTDIEDFDPEAVSFFRGETAIGEAFQGFSNLQEPVFYIVFAGEEGQMLDITLESEDFDTVLYVFGNGGDRIAFNDDIADEATANSAIRGLELPTTGEYLIFATDFFFVNAITGLSEDEVSLFRGGEFIMEITEQ